MSDYFDILSMYNFSLDFLSNIHGLSSVYPISFGRGNDGGRSSFVRRRTLGLALNLTLD